MLVGEPSPAPRVVAGLRKLRPELTPAPVPTPADPQLRISGVLRQYYGGWGCAGEIGAEWSWVRAAVRDGCLLAWREGTLPRRPAARLPLRHLHLRAAPHLPYAFQLSRLRDDTAVATFQTCNATEYARWVRALCVEILRQTPLPQVRFLDVLPAADSAIKEENIENSISLQKNEATYQKQNETLDLLTPPCPPRAPPRARRRLLSAETQLPRRDHSPAATDEGIVVEDDDFDSSSDRSLDLSLSLEALKTSCDVVDGAIEVLRCDNCSKLNTSLSPIHHTLPRTGRTNEFESQAKHRYLKRWETATGGTERGRYSTEASRRKSSTLESRARSCSPKAQEVTAQFIPVRERRALFESLSRSGGSLTRSSEQLSKPVSASDTTPRRAASLHNLQEPPTRSVSDLRQFFEAVARGTVVSCAVGILRHSAPPLHIHRTFASLTCA